MIGPIKTVGVYVRDQQIALAFYTAKLGFELRRELPTGAAGTWIEISPPGGQTCLVLYPRSMMPDWNQRKSSVVFHCADIEDTCRRLEADGVTITMPPKAMPWGMFAMFVDPDGNEFGLTSQPIA
jgi:lactoylglutathione lyase